MSIGDGGDVTFTGDMYGPAIPDIRFRPGVWAGKPTHVVNVLRGGVNGPGVDGYLYGTVHPQVDLLGELAVESNLNPEVGYGRDSVIWVGRPEQLQVAAREGEHAPGTEPTTRYGVPPPNSGTLGSFFEDVQLNDRSELTFSSLIYGPGVPPFQSGLWSGTSGALRLIAGGDLQASDLPAGVSYSRMSGHDNPHGTIGFKSFLKGAGVGGWNDVAVWVGTPGDIHLVAREGEPAPGIRRAELSELARGPAIKVDYLGRVLFNGIVSGHSVNSTNELAYWIGNKDRTDLLFRNGDPVVGQPGLRFADLYVGLGPPAQYTVLARLMGAGVADVNDNALFVGTPDSLRLIVREGMQAPSLAPGVTIGEFAYENGRLGIPASPFGHLAFQTQLRGAGVNSSNDVAFYMVNTDGTLFLVAREGNQLDLGGGVFKRIDYLDTSFAAPSDETMNSQGQLVFRASFTDGTSGIFIAQIIPEPSSAALMLAGLVLIASARYIRSRTRKRLNGSCKPLSFGHRAGIHSRFSTNGNSSRSSAALGCRPYSQTSKASA